MSFAGSFPVVDGLLPIPRAPKSRPVPGVLGVFEAPKEANAPVPKPNALDALVGEAIEAATELKGFLLLCEELSAVFLPIV